MRESVTNEENCDNPAAKNEGRAASVVPRPTKAIRRYCLWCCNGSTLEVNLCPAKACPLWTFRFGRKPTANLLAQVGGQLMYPLEDPTKVADFHKNGGTRLDAMRHRCIDCSGGSMSKVRDCRHVSCHLHPFRLRENPNRKMSPEQRKIAAARLRANLERKKRKRGDPK